jgi:hypothetical protein
LFEKKGKIPEIGLSFSSYYGLTVKDTFSKKIPFYHGKVVNWLKQSA